MSPEELIFQLTGINVRLHRGLGGQWRLTVDEEAEKRVKPFLVRNNWEILYGDSRYQDPWTAVCHFLRMYLEMHAGCEFAPDGTLCNGNQLDGWMHDQTECRRLRLMLQIEELTYRKRGLTNG